MKAVVFAYHDMGCLGVQALLDAGYEISAIFTHADNPAEKVFYGSVSRLAAWLVFQYMRQMILIIHYGWNVSRNSHQTLFSHSITVTC